MAVELTQANVRLLKDLILLARASQRYLSIYVPVEVGSTTTSDLRQLLKSSLDSLQRDLEGREDPDPLKTFLVDRRSVEEYLEGLRPNGLALALFFSNEADLAQAVWLPRPVVAPEVRYGKGAYVLPLLDMLDEFEPVALVIVERDSARLLVLEAGRIERDERISAHVPRPAQSAGKNQARFRNRFFEKEGQFMKQVVEKLDTLYTASPFRRIFIAGQVEAVTRFRDSLSKPLEKIVSGAVSLDDYASDDVIVKKVVSAAEQVERSQEKELVDDLRDRVAKNAEAVSGLAETLGELKRGNVHILVMTPGMEADGRKCDNCSILYPPEDLVCTNCGAKTVEVDLRAELPGYALQHGAELEIAHGQAAEALASTQGIGALLRYVRPTNIVNAA